MLRPFDKASGFSIPSEYLLQHMEVSCKFLKLIPTIIRNLMALLLCMLRVIQQVIAQTNQP
jgi:hypothetical protein